MTVHVNAYDQPVGEPVPGWAPRAVPERIGLEGRYCGLEPLDAERHAAELYAAYATAPDGRNWTYLPDGPFESADDYRRWAAAAQRSDDPLHYAVIDRATGAAVGTASLIRHNPGHGVIEVGYVVFSPLLQRTPISTEAQYLLMAYVFDKLGYRRYEWKCDALNAPSRKAAERLGFTFEGIFRQAVIYKGRNRDTAWYSIVDGEWPLLREAFRTWLAPENFDEHGRQKHSLTELRTARQDEFPGAGES
ncbi:putative ribosomal N-acetyltransferase YdaF [Streptomyces sp. YIM 130001]|uniref:GNAT family N-acetyltransferase n=1 Tax=Streptomyces sp. YIM 130001 TaxID=2259644 RepID=UPI000E64A22F|nr:GNAT family protein [Streptomyces sp. YIM 130001]RII20729.1 putative ribosomal N-acetyltransferase YdaF [Streptomyces sp. YIM 130001]